MHEFFFALFVILVVLKLFDETEGFLEINKERKLR